MRTMPLIKKRVEVIDHAATGQRNRELRIKSRVSLTDVAQRMGFSIPYICDLEAGRRNWSDGLSEQYQKALQA